MLTARGLGLNPLENAAGPMLALLTRLRNTIAHPMPASLRAQLLGYLRQFEEKARAAGVPQDEVMLSRYVLCTALDEAVMSTPWGSASEWGKQSLLITLHNEAWVARRCSSCSTTACRTRASACTSSNCCTSASASASKAATGS